MHRQIAAKIEASHVVRDHAVIAGLVTRSPHPCGGDNASQERAVVHGERCRYRKRQRATEGYVAVEARCVYTARAGARVDGNAVVVAGEQAEVDGVLEGGRRIVERQRQITRIVRAAIGMRVRAVNHVESGPLVRSSYHAEQQIASERDIPRP